MENTCDDHLHLLLPQDVLIQILVFLPVISLLRFKSVCKSWRALIESSFFIDLHLNTLPPPDNNSYSSKFGTFIFQTSQGDISTDTRESEAFMLSSESSDGDGGDEFEKLKLEDLGFPPCYKVSPGYHEIFMVGSCNGLICLYDTKQRDVSLWNPATRQFRLLPKSLTLAGIGDLDEDLVYKDFVAFGYDVKTKDYKVVQICYFRPYLSGDGWLPMEEYIFRVQVYSLSTDSWRLLEGINSFPAFPEQVIGLNHGVYLNGSYYFLGWYFIDIGSNVRMILSFDFTKEIISTIQFPHPNYSMNLTYLGEKLAVIALTVSNDLDEFSVENYDIWVLNEHGMKESWTKLHSIELNYSGIPRGISNNGEFTLIAAQAYSLGVVNFKLQLFTLVTKEVKKEFQTGHGVIRADVYKQSLVSIDGNSTTADRVIGGAM